jgi:fatty acid desaturase
MKMRLRHRADRRTLLWAFGFMPAAASAQYVWPHLAGFLAPLSIYLAYCAGVIAHNHNHSPTFHSRRTNAVLSAWISFFYGYPVFAWIPTHNENHHRYVNRPGDATITWRLTRRNSLYSLATYFFVSSKHQAPLTAAFLRRARAKSARLYWTCIGQYAVVIGGHVGACILAIALWGFGRGLFVYASALGVPALLALWGLIFTNFVQHVDCDPWSEWNHSRNFVSPALNWLIFDNGFHTIHHEKPGLHWSRARAEHEKIAHLIDPRLNERSIHGYCLKTYVLGALHPRFAPTPLGAYERVRETEDGFAQAAQPTPST